jgi:hypothetical protein
VHLLEQARHWEGETAVYFRMVNLKRGYSGGLHISKCRASLDALCRLGASTRDDISDWEHLTLAVVSTRARSSEFESEREAGR